MACVGCCWNVASDRGTVMMGTATSDLTLADRLYDDGVFNDLCSVIGQHCGSDGTDDDHNDWISDLANAVVVLFTPSLLKLDRLEAVFADWPSDEVRYAANHTDDSGAGDELSDLLRKLADALDVEERASDGLPSHPQSV